MPGGIEFEEPDPIERTVGIQLTGRGDATRQRMRRIAQVKGWDLGTFNAQHCGRRRQRTEGLLSYRGEGKPSLQMVIAVPPVDLPHTYAEFDLDLGNPLQDVLGFVVHMGELLDGKPTNHLDLRTQLAKTSARDYLYCTIE